MSINSRDISIRLNFMQNYDKAPKDFFTKNTIFHLSENADFVKNAAFCHFCHSHYVELLQHFHLISMLYSSRFVAKSAE